MVAEEEEALAKQRDTMGGTPLPVERDPLGRRAGRGQDPQALGASLPKTGSVCPCSPCIYFSLVLILSEETGKGQKAVGVVRQWAGTTPWKFIALDFLIGYSSDSESSSLSNHPR